MKRQGECVRNVHGNRVFDYYIKQALDDGEFIKENTYFASTKVQNLARAINRTGRIFYACASVCQRVPARARAIARVS